MVIEKARRETRFRARAVRIDSTVVEADVRYPTDSGLALDSARVLAREARKLLAKVGARRGLGAGSLARDRTSGAGDVAHVGSAHRGTQSSRCSS